MRTLTLCLLLTTPALAENWRTLDDAGITAALSARVLQYPDGSTQNFFQDGRTLSEAGAGASWGKWWVAGGQYCSTWPPSDVAACYRVEAQGLNVRFIGKAGDVSVGRYVDL
ncbi:MAG: hypothetical protein FD150_90 [Rhodobacteraceae bacterium]|nr:MAG: hypothetical protein FD150_90 [Paracoccaceae bacterium]